VTIHVTSRTPLHTLRKEFGSQINSRFGLTAAQEMLRHANIHTTAAHYVENKQRSVLGFAHLLKSDQRTIVAQGDAVASTDLATATKTTLVATSLFAWHSRDQPPDSLMESNPCGRRYKQPTRT
jgi:hypothetical protein